MPRLDCSLGLLVLAGSFGCASVSESLPTRAPVMLGPVDHIGGKAEPVIDDLPDKTAFDRDNEMFMMLCEESGIPTISVTRPAAGTIVENVEHAYASSAGHTNLRALVPRFSSMGVGAWVMFFAGCYGHHYWWNVDGHVQGVGR
jgi:hypothetical protein